jgi:hypothetical protein
MWVHKLLTNLFGHVLDSTVIHYDNQGCVKLLDNPMFHDKSKDIKIKYHYIRDMVQRKEVLVQYLPTTEKVVDVLTKLGQSSSTYVVENASLAEREC